MKTSTTLFLLATAFPLTAPYPSSNQPVPPNPATVCSSLSIIQLFTNDLNAFPTQSDVYMAEAQALAVDWNMQCPTENGILKSDGAAPDDACKKNQELKDAIEELRFSTSEDRRLGVKGIIGACLELAGMLGCLTK